MKRLFHFQGVDMTYIFHENADPAEIDRFVTESDQNSLFQCSEWADVKNNWNHYFVLAEEEGKTVAAALILSRRMPLGKCLFYIPRGPVMDYYNEELVRFFLGEITALAKRKHAVAVRFDPNVYSRKYKYADRNEPHPYMNQDVIEILKKCGAGHKGYTTMIEEATQPRFNAALDCPDNYYELLDHRTRQSIHTAERKGAVIHCGHEYLDDFAKAMQFTEQRKGVALRNLDYFRNMMNVYGERCIIMTATLNFSEQISHLKEELENSRKELETCTGKRQKNQLLQKIKNDEKDLEILEKDREREGRDEVILAGKLGIYNDRRMEFVYMGNNADYLRIRASYLLYKKYLDICVEKGIRYVSMGGIEGTLDDGLTKFKSNWLMDVEEYIGEFNIVLDPLVYHAFDTVYPWVLKKAAQIRSGKKESIH